MKRRKEFLIALIMSVAVPAMIALTLNGCKKPEGVAPILPGNEFLTTTLLIITDPSGVLPTDTLIWSEVPPATTPDTLRSFATLVQNHTYHIQIIILDSTQVHNGVLPNAADSSAFVVSNEIISRQNYHLFCFYDASNTNDIYGTNQSSLPASSWANVTVTNPNYDMNNPPLPFGITDNLNTFGPTQGQLEIILRHQPDVKNGQCAPGSTDLDVYYNLKVQ